MSFDARAFLQSLFGLGTSEELPSEGIEDFLERSAILELDGGLSVEMADAQALQEVTQRIKSAMIGVNSTKPSMKSEPETPRLAVRAVDEARL